MYLSGYSCITSVGFAASGALVVLPAASANAADLFEPYPELSAPPAEDFDWIGVYGGVPGGYGKAKFDGAFDLSELDEGFPDGSETTFADVTRIAGRWTSTPSERRGRRIRVWAATDRMSFEGLYHFFDDETDTSGVTDAPDSGDFVSLENAWVVRAGLNFLFL